MTELDEAYYRLVHFLDCWYKLEQHRIARNPEDYAMCTAADFINFFAESDFNA